MAKQPSFPSFKMEVDDINRSRPTAKIYADKSSIAHIVQRTKPYKNLPDKFRPVLEKMADYVRIKMIPEVFKEEGPGWAPLAQRTINERIAQGFKGAHPILYRSGDLFEELTKKSHPGHIEIIKVGKMARIEIGGSSEKFIRNQMGYRETRLPARPMIPGTGEIEIGDHHRMELERIAKKEIARILNRS